MLEPVGLAPERETAGVVQDAVQHRRGEGPVPHELLPLRDLLVGGKTIDERSYASETKLKKRFACVPVMGA
jgi:hypothetical protein